MIIPMIVVMWHVCRRLRQVRVVLGLPGGVVVVLIERLPVHGCPFLVEHADFLDFFGFATPDELDVLALGNPHLDLAFPLSAPFGK